MPPKLHLPGKNVQPQPAATHSRRTVVCASEGQFQTQIDAADISELLTRPGTFVWLDLHDPQPDDLQLLRDEFGFHPLSIEDAARHHERPKLEAFDTYYFMVFYALHYMRDEQKLLSQALGLFIGANYLVSVHPGPIATIDETIARWQNHTAEFGNDSGALLYALLDAIVDDYFPVIDELAERVEDIEQQIFEHFREEALQEVFSLKRDLLAVRRVVAPERDVLNVLIRREVPIFERNTILYLQDVYDHIVRITDSIDTYRDLLSSALDAFLSLQSNQLNQVVKVLTIASIILMCNALVAGIYGMNFEFMPELHWRLGYPWALALMVGISLGLLWFFRRRRWL
ncbi:MAG TPA: magnesium/cobalt transporter CorA [Kouleothrix sp.]|nr:magnesium/cobalt transporter CorA [Kouleothrix sp.]